MCAKLFTSITAMFLITNVVLAQNLTANISNTNDSDFFYDLISPKDENVDFYEVSKVVYYDVPLQVSQFDSKTNAFSIAKGTISYSKAELLDRSSNKTIMSVGLTPSTNQVDMSDVPSGSYYLILTNKTGDVHSEKIVIF